MNTAPELSAILPYGSNDPVDDWDYERIYKSHKLEPEWRLLLAVLNSAIEEARYPPNNPKNIAIRRYAWMWIDSNDTSRIFSFLNVCESLRLSPTAVRKGIHARYGTRRV